MKSRLSYSPKRRSGKDQRNKLLPDRLVKAAKNLREDESIVSRRADKTAIYVILDKADYAAKLDTILSDESKFKRSEPTPPRISRKR